MQSGKQAGQTVSYFIFAVLAGRMEDYYMKQTHSVAELKAMARENMLGKYGTAIALSIIMEAISFAVSLACEFMIDTNTIFGRIVLYIIQFILLLVMYIFSVGTCRFYMNICRNRQFRISDLFYGFQHNPDKAIVTGFLILLISAACFIPFIGCAAACLILDQALLILAAAFALILGITAYFYFTITYGFSFVLLADDRNDLTVIGLLRESRRLMAGNRLRYFYMAVSFLGWLLLGLFTCGIAYLWIMPYISCASTLFYLDIIGILPFSPCKSDQSDLQEQQ